MRAVPPAGNTPSDTGWPSFGRPQSCIDLSAGSAAPLKRRTVTSEVRSSQVTSMIAFDCPCRRASPRSRCAVPARLAAPARARAPARTSTAAARRRARCAATAVAAIDQPRQNDRFSNQLRPRVARAVRWRTERAFGRAIAPAFTRFSRRSIALQRTAAARPPGPSSVSASTCASPGFDGEAYRRIVLGDVFEASPRTAAHHAERIFRGELIDEASVPMQIHHRPPRQALSFSRPRRIHDLTVPSGTFNTSATSLWLWSRR